MKQSQAPNFWHSLVTFGGVIVIVIVGLLWFGISLHSLLLIALIWVSAHAVAIGFDFQDLCVDQGSGLHGTTLQTLLE